MADSALVQKAVEAVLELCTPDKMPAKADAVDFLEDVVSSLDASIEALKEELEEDC
jgi:hypothetical protein